MIKIIDKDVLSSDKVHWLKGRVYLPEGQAKGLFHVVHGMIEHIGMFDALMRRMAEAGYIAFGYDHLGHGRTARDKSELGFIAEQDGWEKLVDDVYLFGSSIRRSYPEELPFILMGHSMGSFIVRLAAVKYRHCDKLIVIGTGGPNSADAAGIFMTGLLKRLKGDHARSDLIEKMVFGTYNRRFAGENDPIAWLTVDPAAREQYRTDALCAFRFSVSAMQDLIRLHHNCNTKQWFRSVDRELPILLISGSDDPVGGYGKGIAEIDRRLKASGANVQSKLYEGYRHEIFNDHCREEVTADILAFIGL